MSLTAFFDVLLWRGFAARTWKSSSLFTNLVSFCRILTDSVSSGPISPLNIPSSIFDPSIDVVDLLLMNESISVLGSFLSYFLAIYCFFILLKYLLVDANRGISLESHST